MEVLGLVRLTCQEGRWHYLLVDIDMPWAQGLENFIPAVAYYVTTYRDLGPTY